MRVSSRPRFGLSPGRALWCVLAIGAIGCDLGEFATSPTTRCTEAGAQCVLTDGPLGVCERTPCAAGTPPPCFQCTPQH